MAVEIEGLADFNRYLKVAAGKSPDAVKEANYDLAEAIRKAAMKRASIRSQAAKAARSLRSSKSAKWSVISGGGGRVPFFYGAEFGSKRYGQFMPWRGNAFGGWSGGPGYFLHPAIREEGPEAVEKYWVRMQKILDDAFPS